MLLPEAVGETCGEHLHPQTMMAIILKLLVTAATRMRKMGLKKNLPRAKSASRGK